MRWIGAMERGIYNAAIIIVWPTYSYRQIAGLSRLDTCKMSNTRPRTLRARRQPSGLNQLSLSALWDVAFCVSAGLGGVGCAVYSQQHRPFSIFHLSLPSPSPRPARSQHVRRILRLRYRTPRTPPTPKPSQ